MDIYIYIYEEQKKGVHGYGDQFWAYTLVDSRPQQLMFERERAPITHLAKPFRLSLSWRFFGRGSGSERRIQADYVSLIWDLKMV